MGQNRSISTNQLIILKFLFKISFSIILLSIIVFFSIDTIQYKYNLMDIEDYDPISTLKFEKKIKKKTKYPIVDVHNHQFDIP